MVFLHALVVGLLAFGTVNAQVEDNTWLTKAIENKESELAGHKATLLYYETHPSAAVKAQQDAQVWLSAWQPAKDQMMDMSKFSVKELLIHEIQGEEADLLARRAALKELLADPVQLKAAEANLGQNFKVKSTDTNATLQSLLEDDLEEQEEALEERKKALKYFEEHPEKLTEAEKLRDKVLERMVADGDITAENMEKGMKIGVIEALNASVIESEKQIKAMRYALEILEQGNEGSSDQSPINSEMTSLQGRGGFGRGERFGDRNGGRFGDRNGGRNEGRFGDRDGGRNGGRFGDRDGGRNGGRFGDRDGGRFGDRDGGRFGDRDGDFGGRGGWDRY